MARLGEILIQQGACTAASVREALRNQVIFGGRLGTNLLEIGAVREDALAHALGTLFRSPSLSGNLKVDPAAVALLRPDVADRQEVVPYLLADRRVAVLACDPSDLRMLDEVAFATGRRVHPIVTPEARLWLLLRQAYGIDRRLRGIEVDFGTVRQGLAEAPAGGPRSRAPGTAAGDLMDEAEFDTLYVKTGPYGIEAPGSAPSTPTATPAAPPAEGEEILELDDEFLEPIADPASEVLAFLSTGAGHAPPVRFVPPAARREEPEPSPLAFAVALRFLEGVGEREAIARTVLRYARSKFRRAVLLTVHRGAAQGWAGLGEQLGAERVRKIGFPLGTPGIVDTVVRTRAHFLGPIPRTEANIRLLKQLGGGVPGNAFLVPILALGQVVNVFYADNGRGAMVDASGVGELLILATRIAQSYDALVARVR